MQLIYLKNELDSNKEHELISENEFGFNVRIQYKENNWREEKSVYLYNCTEIHNLFNNKAIKSIAFESDIHSDGFINNIDDIMFVNIELSSNLNDKYIEYTLNKIITK